MYFFLIHLKNNNQLVEIDLTNFCFLQKGQMQEQKKLPG